MNSRTQFVDTTAHLVKLLQALDDISPNPYLNQVNRAKTVSELYEATLRLRWAANSKELRDTGDENVHILSNEIFLCTRKLDSFLRIKIFPSSSSQRQSWEHSVSRDAGAAYGFQDDGSLEISLLDATMCGSTVHVKRILSHVSSVSGSWNDFKLKLDAAQIKDFQRKLSELRSTQIAFIKLAKISEEQ